MREQLTQKDVERIEAEIEHRKLVVRKEALEAVKEARAHGDLSENFEYHAAKRDKNKNESRIRYLERMLRTAEIVSEDSAADEVGLNNTVTLYFEEDDECEEFRLVTSIRGNSLKKLISIESPLGKAVYGKKLGERVFVLVGDSGVDVKTAENAGMDFIGVAWGFCGKKELLELGADTVVDEPSEILKLININ